MTDSGDLRIGLRCPICRNLDWYCDGLVVAEVDGGRLSIERVHDAGTGDDAGTADDAPIWSCNQCAHELPRWTALSRALTSQVTPVPARIRAS